MTGFDWSAMITQLEGRQAALDQERADVVAIIAEIRRRAGLAVPGVQLPERNGGKKHVGTKGRARHGRIPDAETAAMRKEWEAGTAAAAIAKKFGMKEGRVYYYATSRGWKRPKVAAPKAGAVKTPKGEQLAGSVKCPKCGSMTDFDPCRYCGEKLKRPW